MLRHSLRPARACYSSCGGLGKASVLSEKAAQRILNLVPLRFFAERERASKGTIAGPGRAEAVTQYPNQGGENP